MSIYKRILVPSDFSNTSLSALRHASKLAMSCGAELCLLHVIPESRRDIESLNDLKVAAIQKLEQLLPANQMLELKTRFLASEGHAAKVIVRTAQEIEADLIVIGTHGRSGFLHFALGSVTESVLRTSACPVLTVLGEKETGTTASATAVPEIADEELDAAPVIELLRRAIGLRATDIHVDPVTDEEFLVRFRIDGKLEDYCKLDRMVAIRQIHQLKILSRLDVADPFHAKEGRLKSLVSLPDLEVRITTSPVADGEAVALRLSAKQNLSMPLEQLGLSENTRRAVEQMSMRGEGMILVTGRTGSGKTTTVYSLLTRLAEGKRNIASIEDPVEYGVPYVRQLQVDERHGLTMASGLKTILRMDPDVVFVGEVRDRETGEIALRAASSGRTVLSTLHTRDVASTITAVRDLHLDSRSVAGNLSGIINQRLIRRLCTHCREATQLSESDQAIFVAEGLPIPETVFCATGCDKCRHRGFTGRIGIYEVAISTPALASAIEQGIPESALREHLRGTGTRSLRYDALKRVAEGITSMSELGELSLS